MNGRLTRGNARNVRVEVFFNDRAADFTGSAATAKIAQLAAANAAAQRELQNQVGNAGDIRQDSRLHANAFDSMIANMETLRDFAVSLARLNPGLENKFRISRTGGKTAKIAANGGEIKEMFFNSCLDENFFTSLKTKTDAAQQSLNAAQAAAGKRSGATDALESNVRTASRTVEDLRPLVNYICRDNLAKLAEWTPAAAADEETGNLTLRRAEYT